MVFYVLFTIYFIKLHELKIGVKKKRAAISAVSRNLQMFTRCIILGSDSYRHHALDLCVYLA